jgi:hypothetical protein
MATLTYCSYTFFEQCPHRTVCAHCDFYTPKGSSQAQLLEARDNLQHMLVFIPLTGDECATVEDGRRLSTRWADNVRTTVPGSARSHSPAKVSAYACLDKLCSSF